MLPSTATRGDATVSSSAGIVKSAVRRCLPSSISGIEVAGTGRVYSVTVGEKGVFRFRLLTHGVAGHAREAAGRLKRYRGMSR